MPKQPLVGVAVAVCLLAAGATAAEAKTSKRESGVAVHKASHVRKASVHKPAAAPKARRSSKAARSGSPEQVAEAPAQYGPFLPPVYYDYPQPPCDEFDTVVEAHVHESDAETPEPADVAEEALPGDPVNAWKRVTRKLSTFLRPKSSESTIRPEDVDLSDLLSAGVQIPVEGVNATNLRDSFLNSRGKHAQHLAIDIGSPKGTPVLAAADGQILQIRREKRGGNALYQKDASGKYMLYYCHLSRYVKTIHPGDKVKKGDVIAYVGATGHVIGGSHLHFSITRLPEDDDNFKAGVAINPYLLFLAAVP